MIKKLAISFLIIVLIAGCAEEARIKQMDKTERFSMAKRLFETKHYNDARLNFEILTSTSRGYSFIDSAQYYLANCHFKLSEFISAASEFNRLISDFPVSQLSDDANYMVAMSYYELSPKYSLDQQYTLRAITELEKLITYYPQSEYLPKARELLITCKTKLAEKEFRAGEQYVTLKNYESGIIYLNSVIENFPESLYVAQALILKSEALFFLERYDEAISLLNVYLSIYPEDENVDNAKALIGKINQAKQK